MMKINELENVVFQLSDTVDEQIGQDILRLKSLAAEQDEHEANYLWCLHQVWKVKKNFTDAFWKMKRKKYQEAWFELDRADIELSFLENHYEKYIKNYSHYKVQFELIKKYIRNYQMLFPYKYFLSREAIIKEEKCSICDKVVRLRGGCKHRIGHLYNGVQCSHIVTDMEIMAYAIVTNPFDKYSFLQLKDVEYDYKLIERLMDNLFSPYDLWTVEKVQIKKNEYVDIGVNDICPCGSGKKYKKCCINTTNEMQDHFKVKIQNMRAFFL